MVAHGLMDPDLLPEIAASCLDGYLKGLRDGGWAGSEDAVRVAVGACDAAKFSWFGPAVLGRTVSNDLGSSNYSKDEAAELVVERVAGMVTLITDWARLAGPG
ncbi:hypothetical protein [Salinispora cortesiana]|uniref:hypothetical protein n=1 Tax=Salinispora cortesiana TaxID=1305843 RepID=UPI0004062169|nr:hypothetical protein [Salinispora cortesiana]